MLVSVVIRTLNESQYLDELIVSILNQKLNNFEIEIVVVDSGSTDGTLEIAQKHKCQITHIKKDEFTFGKSLNIGCEYSKGNILVFISGHCVPANSNWLECLISPLLNSQAGYSYGRQFGRDATKFSERCLFDKYFPSYSKIPQEGFYCNNANAALRKETWEKYKFDEYLTGLEDMHLAKRIVADGGKVGYVSDAIVYHIHNESWQQLRIRYEREAYALQKIMPEVHLSIIDVFKYFFAGVFQDFSVAVNKRKVLSEGLDIIIFRFMQYWGAYKGNHVHRQLSSKTKYRYFYPKDIEKHLYEKEDNSFAADEGKQ